MKHAVFVAPFGYLAAPHRLIELATAAEDCGWDGLFLWDHILRPESNEILDPWVVMGALAQATETLRLGPMVTPLPRRRPIKLAREILTVDLLSQGRITVGLGLGVDSGGEFTRFDEVTDPRTRGAMLDEGADLLAALFEGELVATHEGHFTVDGVVLEPRPVQAPRPPMWFAARGGAGKPVRRAARFDGLFPIDMDADQYNRALDEIVTIRGSLDGFDVAVKTTPGELPPDFVRDTATWAMHSWPAVADLNDLFNTVMAGPPG